MAFANRDKEERFLSQHRDDTAEKLRWVCLLGAAIMIGFMWQDTFMSTSGDKAIKIRLFGALPVSALVWYLSYNLEARRFISYISAFFWLSYTCFTAAIFIVYEPGPYGLTSSTGLGSFLIILFGIFAFSNLRFLPSLLVGFLSLLIYAVSVALWTKVAFVDFIMGDFLTAVALMIGAAAKTLFTDRARRRQFETSALLSESYNMLEQLVRERTSELQITNAQLTEEITDRKHVEEALRESEERYKGLAEESFAGVYVVQDRLFTFINDNAASFAGYRRDELEGRCSDSIVHPDDRAGVKLKARSMLKSKDSFPHEFRIVTKDGQIRWIMETVASIRYNGKPAILGNSMDITDRKRAEEALKKSERNLSDIIEFLPDATFVIDLEGTVIAWNRAIEEMTGIPKEKMLGQKDHAYTIPFYGERRRQLLDLIDESDQELESKYKTIQRKGSTLYAEAFAPALYGGKGAHFWATGAPLFDDSGNRVGAIESIRDISEHKKTEEEKRSLEERLNRAEKMEALGTLAGGVAHDLNNVLGVVVGYAELLMMKADESSSIRPQLVNIMNGGLKAAAIVDDLLTLARRGVSDRDVLNLNKIIADCQTSPEFEKLYSYHPSVKIETDIDPNLPNISGSSVHLGKSLYNLISNASEAMTKGGIVTIKTTNQYLDKPIQGYDQIREGDYVVLSVSDTGEGISADNLKRIFEPFYTKKVMGRSGTGLGLAVVWGTVRDHHGYINVESEEGKGSTFTLYFPVTREDITTEAIAVPVSEYRGSGESILVVDDVKEQRDLAAGMLGTLNYNVLSVSSGEEAIVYLKEHKIDLMVLDMIMDHGMDGLDTYKQVLEIHPRQKAIIISGFSESDRVRAAKDLGAGAYVRKPYIKEKLGLAVKKELDRYE